MCTGKSVLHLGFIQHSHLYEKLIKNDTWLHKKLDKVSKHLVGIDYLEKDIEIIRKKYGYECYYGDATRLENLDIENKFDVIVCGKLIEHIENAGLMLDGIKKFMTPDSILIITTPNPWSRRRIKLIKKGIMEDQWLNPEHTCWYSYETLKQLLKRKGYLKVQYSYYSDKIPQKSFFKQLKIIYRKFNPIKEYYSTRLFFIVKKTNNA